MAGFKKLFKKKNDLRNEEALAKEAAALEEKKRLEALELQKEQEKILKEQEERAMYLDELANLREAITVKDISKIESFFHNGFREYYEKELEENILSDIILLNNKKLIVSLVSKGLDPVKIYNNDIVLLHKCYLNNQLDTLKQILPMVNPSRLWLDKKFNIFILAANKNDDSLMELVNLLSKEQLNEISNLLLYTTVETGNKEAYMELISLDVDHLFYHEAEWFLDTILNAEDSFYFDELISYNKSIVFEKNEDNETILFSAVRMRNIHLVEMLVKMGVDYNQINNFQETPYSIAIEMNDETITDYFEQVHTAAIDGYAFESDAFSYTREGTKTSIITTQLKELRDLRSTGAISEEEFNKLKKKLFKENNIK